MKRLIYWLIYIEICLEHLGNHTYYHTIFLPDLREKKSNFQIQDTSNTSHANCIVNLFVEFPREISDHLEYNFLSSLAMNLDYVTLKTNT